LHGEHHLDIGRLSAGLKMMLWGLFKKVVLADRLAVYVNMVYGHPADHSGATLLLATYCFAFQIYCDFSGYSDIAIGCARVLGYDLMQNFRLPYLATSVSDFWSRWHISLSTWFKDYLYLPLGGNRVTPRRWAFNIMTVFLVSGLWHGASWMFVVWGALHGFYYLVGRSTAGFRSKLKETLGIRGRLAHVLQILVTFHLVLIAWVFFRARSLADAVHILGRIAGDLGGALDLGTCYVRTVVTLLLVLILVAVQILQMRGVLSLYFSRPLVPSPVRWVGYLSLIFAILYLGMSTNAFIYFQF
jgi:D-alanyl-lipoteichoic acid acyltransferase DltB (MBOAT superfamily)